jgi:hypothetical protein
VKIELDYGKEGLEIELPEGPSIEILEQHAILALEVQEETVRQAMRRPIDSPPLRELMATGDRVRVESYYPRRSGKSSDVVSHRGDRGKSSSHPPEQAGRLRITRSSDPALVVVGGPSPDAARSF